MEFTSAINPFEPRSTSEWILPENGVFYNTIAVMQNGYRVQLFDVQCEIIGGILQPYVKFFAAPTNSPPSTSLQDAQLPEANVLVRDHSGHLQPYVNSSQLPAIALSITSLQDAQLPEANVLDPLEFRNMIIVMSGRNDYEILRGTDRSYQISCAKKTDMKMTGYFKEITINTNVAPGIMRMNTPNAGVTVKDPEPDELAANLRVNIQVATPTTTATTTTTTTTTTTPSPRTITSSSHPLDIFKDGQRYLPFVDHELSQQQKPLYIYRAVLLPHTGRTESPKAINPLYTSKPESQNIPLYKPPYNNGYTNQQESDYTADLFKSFSTDVPYASISGYAKPAQQDYYLNSGHDRKLEPSQSPPATYVAYTQQTPVRFSYQTDGYPSPYEWSPATNSKQPQTWSASFNDRSIIAQTDPPPYVDYDYLNRRPDWSSLLEPTSAGKREGEPLEALALDREDRVMAARPAFDEEAPPSTPVTALKVIAGTDIYRDSAERLKIGSEATLVLSWPYTDYWDVSFSSCVAHDGSGNRQTVLLDTDGCPAYDRMRSDVNRYSDGKISYLYVTYEAFRFPDRPQMYYECAVNLCRHRCTPTECGRKTSKGQKESPTRWFTQRLSTQTRSEQRFERNPVKLPTSRHFLPQTPRNAKALFDSNPKVSLPALARRGDSYKTGQFAEYLPHGIGAHSSGKDMFMESFDSLPLDKNADLHHSRGLPATEIEHPVPGRMRDNDDDFVESLPLEEETEKYWLDDHDRFPVSGSRRDSDNVFVESLPLGEETKKYGIDGAEAGEARLPVSGRIRYNDDIFVESLPLEEGTEKYWIDGAETNEGRLPVSGRIRYNGDVFLESLPLDEEIGSHWVGGSQTEDERQLIFVGNGRVHAVGNKIKRSHRSVTQALPPGVDDRVTVHSAAQIDLPEEHNVYMQLETCTADVRALRDIQGSSCVEFSLFITVVSALGGAVILLVAILITAFYRMYQMSKSNTKPVNYTKKNASLPPVRKVVQPVYPRDMHYRIGPGPSFSYI
ncbi:PREDICTED: uncharacterized protein LOC106810381 [Priapulus caudatus]|uniref:Uncharacterized protein LOC106810381 n=1 Tax=Priapulus caudatus TaxID=37621 RepID=A0ABM1EAG9_PRICU|nr:PREDICTED: uncharacterized protein LOC106810381 [Priapulus caudatus]